MDPAVAPRVRRRRRLHALSHNLSAFMPTRTPAWPEGAERWSLTTLHEKPAKVSAKVVSHGRHVTLHMAEVAVARRLFAAVLWLIARLRAPPTPACGQI